LTTDCSTITSDDVFEIIYLEWVLPRRHVGETVYWDPYHKKCVCPIGMVLGEAVASQIKPQKDPPPVDQLDLPLSEEVEFALTRFQLLHDDLRRIRNVAITMSDFLSVLYTTLPTQRAASLLHRLVDQYGTIDSHKKD
jgi:hypothetical protein